MADSLIRPYHDKDAAAVLSLFEAVNRHLAPPNMREVFETYIQRSVEEEIGRIPDYYAERASGFWVVEAEGAIIGMFGLETTSESRMELRRMYVALSWRRRGIARRMLAYAENECWRRGVGVLELSTSELQQAALQLYQQNGFDLLSQLTAEQSTNKTVGSGVRRYQFEKEL